ncbi:bifunctional 4-hydroxy-2-oxoglutarate aldolase/2-dehydro-3-deoxy-phosphogluconate aldolase [Lederbergia citrea]|uniref:Bifunctional 4-hydroxy-2-oxoglutarate aldolase/2-dehydro-3-deoxy-phosphogluconate aldolase n=1 Tax=Lederbergia citrea TaxID=2833581 RepID=A0A942Z3J9_9BACI|nr:bifunctional 4-hydroxy-2-oxoglutarate aldolase/2-dehydro-3-deoxy-phosphogluconate aldolase [Lederbergia citrea]MBS4176128.1 bifunctional 4-hydroxy-2-oxoglutarate aldolase/2-dehydro-3-deoxy-phosphogluconate aldolase [Lederbergia citrea]MBS4222644.1 bifunctional 4-hydroxy-2-oxoglutarate aldolase/2-dehydro-3-deoxy-phosphogluconate aldolase [Lederbergia citrea]
MKLIELVKREKIVVIVRGIKPEDSLSVAEALVAGGIRFIEVTMNTEGALAIIQQWRERFKNEEIFIGAGTVLDREMATAAIEAGAQFIVTPNLDEEVVKLSCEKNIDIFPGVMTPTEIVKALKAGAKAVKLFPMGSLGLNYLKEIRAPLSDVQILATGGVNLENIQEYLKNGVIGVGIGSNIIDKKLIEEKNFQGITELARKYIEAVKDVEKYG